MSETTFLPDTPLRKTWHVLILAATIWYAWTVPLFLVHHIGIPAWSRSVDLVLTILFCLDLLINFRTAIPIDGELATRLDLIRPAYLKGKFPLDLIATLPWDFFAMFLGFWDAALYLTLVRLLRIVRLPELLRFHRTDTMPSQGERLFSMTFWVMIITSWCASFWMMINDIPKDEDLITFIVKAYYWSVTTMASVGYGDITPTTNLGRIFAMFVMLLGVAMYAFIIGHISTVIVNVNALRQRNMEKLEKLTVFMRQYELPQRVQQDIFSFYRHFLLEHSAGGEELLRELPLKLSERINQHVNIHLLRRGPMFHKASQELLEALGARLKSEMFLPGEEIIRIGDVGHEMYILVHGVVSVTNDQGELLAKLRNKDIFGEIALLQDTVRTANIRALTACNTLKLDKHDFDDVMNAFPEFRKEIKKIQMQRASAR
ncbi:MAG: cyclic nucleotide-binding domain-containing protein [Magnetococcales bacterium]|nr:cyclic nucleotide-binding domain-containing protein [Magnetococcales bacterium]